MARRKQAITQRDFSLGVLNEDFLEGDDLEARQKSMRGGLNIRVTSSRTPKGSAGLFYRSNLGTAEDVIEIRPATGLVFGLIVKDTSLDIIDANANVVQTFASVPWSDASGV